MIQDYLPAYGHYWSVYLDKHSDYLLHININYIFHWSMYLTQTMLCYWSLSLSFTGSPLIFFYIIMIQNHENIISLILILYDILYLLYSIQLMHSIAHSVIMTSLRLTSSETTIHVHMSVCKQIKKQIYWMQVFLQTESTTTMYADFTTLQ